MLENVYKGLNARSEVYLSKEYFCKMYPSCVSSKLCKFNLKHTVVGSANSISENPKTKCV